MTHINPNKVSYTGFNKIKKTETPKTETTKTEITASNSDPKKLGNDLEALAMNNRPISFKPSVERKEGFDMNAIMEKYGSLDPSTTQMLSVVSSPEKSGNQAVKLFEMADQKFGAAQGLDIANSAVKEFFA